jgi:hypothetical protein
MSKSSIKQVLANHPRLLSVLFTLLLYLSQVGSVIADGGGGHAGP